MGISKEEVINQIKRGHTLKVMASRWNIREMAFRELIEDYFGGVTLSELRKQHMFTREELMPHVKSGRSIIYIADVLEMSVGRLRLAMRRVWGLADLDKIRFRERYEKETIDRMKAEGKEI